MPALLLLLSVFTLPAWAIELAPQKLFSGGLGIRVPQFLEVLPVGGPALECKVSTPGFGYRLLRTAETTVQIEVISNGKNEGEKSRKAAELKDYGDPLIAYVAHFTRYENSGSYFEMLISRKADPRTGIFGGFVMFTESFYGKGEDGKETEELKPLAKTPLACTPEE